MSPADPARAGLGALLLLRPGLAARAAGAGSRPDVEVVTRVLGARYLLQAAASAWLARGGRRRTVLRVDALVDGTHAASMVVAAGLRPATARPALLSAVLATAFAVADLRAASLLSRAVGQSAP
jgi:hypothetical protein